MKSYVNIFQKTDYDSIVGKVTLVHSSPEGNILLKANNPFKAKLKKFLSKLLGSNGFVITSSQQRVSVQFLLTTTQVTS